MTRVSGGASSLPEITGQMAVGRSLRGQRELEGGLVQLHGGVMAAVLGCS